MPEDTYLLDVKVAFAQLVINCGARRLNLDPFQVLLGELFTYAGQPTEPFRTIDVLDGWSTEDEFGMGPEPDAAPQVATHQVSPPQVAPQVVEDTDVESEDDEPRAKAPRRSMRLAERSTNHM